MAAYNAVINVQKSLYILKPSDSSRWLSSPTWLSLYISQLSCRKWEDGQRPTSFQEERNYSAMEFKSKNIRYKDYRGTTYGKQSSGDGEGCIIETTANKEQT
ncbi:hypothetical protein PBY51_015734 [Eleginops maclovinus]|uniref:Uncharacterized protein n=1 Tax=Eleginops maclovinus TaxID=56733 RepID=A0AAN7XPA1_ELEMC|nr:hypothetical protein PBY51_015734 [Eleginops maclovinus]